jgi:hypothetical protein
MRFSPEILPIVSIYTSISRMLSIWIGTPDSFEMKHIEVCRIFLSVRSKLMQKINCDFLLWMCESTHISIVTGFNSAGVALAELYFVLLWVVELFNSVVCSCAAIS